MASIGAAERRGQMSARRVVWLVVCLILTLAIAGLFGAVVRQSWVNNDAAARVVHLEEQGAEMLHPMTTLVSELVKARSAAVRGTAVDAQTLTKALNSLKAIDGKYGAALGTTQRLSDLTRQVQQALSGSETGRAGYDTYSGLVTLAAELERVIGDTSHLVHDPDLDSYYVMEAAIVRLPDAMVYAGSASDLVALAGGAELSGEDAFAAAVARFGVSSAAEAVSDGLTKSVNYTARAALGSNIEERLDTFKAAADGFAPPTMLQDLAATVTAASLAAGANRVFAAANPLAHELLEELQALLEVRADALAKQWRFTATASGSAALIGVALIWLLAVRPSRKAAASGAGPEDPPVGSFASARELLDSEELVHVGRAVRTRGRGDAL